SGTALDAQHFVVVAFHGRRRSAFGKVEAGWDFEAGNGVGSGERGMGNGEWGRPGAGALATARARPLLLFPVACSLFPAHHLSSLASVNAASTPSSAALPPSAVPSVAPAWAPAEAGASSA